MYKLKPAYIDLTDAKRVFDFMKENRFLIAYITGGEPTLHPHLIDMIEYANKLGLVTCLTTNGSNPQMIKELKHSGIFNISVSLDHWDPDICEEIRGFKGIQEREIECLKVAKEIGINSVYSLSYLNMYLNDIEKIVKFSNESLGIPWGFCYPTSTAVNSFRLSGDLSMSQPQILKTVKKLLLLMRKGYNIVNPPSFLEDILGFPEKKPNFYCKGGESVFYIDWNGDVYPCFLMPKLFNILNDSNHRFRKNVRCNRCLINCFREPSILSQLFPTKITEFAVKSLTYRYFLRDVVF